MAVPTFTIVMGVLTCVPFGLAVRETVKGVETPLTVAEQLRIDREERQAERERLGDELEAEEQRQAEVTAAKHALVIGKLHGPMAGTLGPAFAGITLGGPERPELDAQLAPLREAHELDIVAIAEGGTYQSVFIKPMMRSDPLDAFCTQLEESLAGAWGDGVEDRYGRTIWVSSQLEQRAIFDDLEDCELKVEKYTPLAGWFNKSRKSVIPLWAIGQPTTRLVSVLGTRAMEEENVISWLELGIGAGVGPTHLRAFVENGRIVAITANASTDAETWDELERHISEVLGSEPEVDYTWVWKHRPRVELERGSAQLTLTLGTLPDEE